MNEKIKQFWETSALPFFSSVSSKINRKDSIRSEEIGIKKRLMEYHSIECAKKETPPQAIQGMWQAYGTMVSARTRGRFAIAATGVIGLGLLGYRIVLSDQRKEVKAKQSELEMEKEKFESYVKEKEELNERVERSAAEIIAHHARNVDSYLNLEKSYVLVNKQLEVAETFVAKLCDKDSACLSEYHQMKKSVIMSADHESKNERTSTLKV